MQDQIFDMLMQEDEITWQSIIHDLIKTKELNPWDVDISILTQRYIEVIKRMQEANLFISAKVLLASALLLKIKSDNLLSEGIASLDYYLFPPEETEGLDVFIDGKKKRLFLDVEPALTIKTPQARKRRVTVNDLINALEKALEVNDRRIIRHTRREAVPIDMHMPDKGPDISQLIRELHMKIKKWFEDNRELFFSNLIVTNNKKEKLYTFVPLLHLSHQSTIDMDQKEHFGEIYIRLLSKDLNSMAD